MSRPQVVSERRTDRRWIAGVILAITATGGGTFLLSGPVGLAIGLGALAATLSGELLRVVHGRSRDVRDELVAWLASLRAEHADETIDARSHDSFARVGAMLRDHRPGSASLVQTLQKLEGKLVQVDRQLAQTRAQRASWSEASRPTLIGGLAGASEAGIGLKRYGDPANLPPWLANARARPAVLRVGRVLDDVRLLHSADIERTVLTFTLLARALLLVLAPALGALSFAPVPDLHGGRGPSVLWAVALGWTLVTALVAPRLATTVMAESAAGLRTRRMLMAVEVPLAIALTLTSPCWAAVAFAAGWTNWWQRLGPSPAIPEFSWPRLAAWILVTAGTQLAGLAMAAGDLVSWQAGLEVAITIGVIAVIGGSYGAMLPVSVGIAVRVLFLGSRHRRLADRDAQRVLDDIAEEMVRAADALERRANGPQDTTAADILRRAVDDMRPIEPPQRLGAGATLGVIVGAALADGGHDMWVEDPRARATQDRARDAGETLPAVVQHPKFTSAGVADVVVRDDVARILRRLVQACVVEARVHGMARVQTIVSRTDDTIEIRIANEPNPDPPRRRGRGRGAGTIQALARSLPGAGELFRGHTDRSFVGGRPAGELFGVRFSFTVGDTPAGAGPLRTRV